jgi:hypothetical protein
MGDAPVDETLFISYNNSQLWECDEVALSLCSHRQLAVGG